MSTRHLPQRTTVALVTALLGLIGACVPPGAQTDDDARAPLEPTFAPSSPAEGTDADSAGTAGAPPSSPGSPAASAPPATDGSSDEGPATGDASGADTTTGPTAGDPSPQAAPATSSFSDPSGDVEPGRPLMSPPDHADLVGAELERAADGTFTLRIDLRGGAPETAQDDEHTMNIASFYDVSGDGHIDYEVWANLSSTGWGTSQFDNRQGTARFAADDDVSVEVAGGQLVLTFPASAVGGAERFRWSLAGEWGTYEDLQLGTMSRDLAPDDHQPAGFPG